MNVKALLNEALIMLNKAEHGDIFTVSDLFRGIEWKHIPLDIRRPLGKVFLLYVNKNSNLGIVAYDKKSDGVQTYKKI